MAALWLCGLRCSMGTQKVCLLLYVGFLDYVFCPEWLFFICLGLDFCAVSIANMFMLHCICAPLTLYLFLFISSLSIKLLLNVCLRFAHGSHMAPERMRLARLCFPLLAMDPPSAARARAALPLHGWGCRTRLQHGMHF